MKNKLGFTMLEILIVIIIVATVGIGAVISFTNIKDDTADEDLKNKYKEIQRGAALYLDLHETNLNWFIENGSVDIKLNDLRNENYISTDLTNPVTGEEINQEYYVRICVSKDSNNNDFVDSCIIDRTGSAIEYIANSDGLSGGTCCNN